MPHFLSFLVALFLLFAGTLGSLGVGRPCKSRWQEIVVRNKWGYIYSPNFGRGSYFPADTCYWLLTSSDPDQRIRIAFQSFTLQDRVDDQCDDYVALFDGRRETAPSLGTFCGRKSPRIISSSGRNLLIKFITDDELQFPGFRLIYETIAMERDRNNNLDDPIVSDTTTIGAPLSEDAEFLATLSTLKCEDSDGSLVQDLLRQVGDTKMTASSSWRNHPPWLARLDNKATALVACCWAAENSADDSSYIQAEFDSKKTVHAIVTQGSDILDEWVTSYRFAYGLNGGDFTYYKTYDGKIKLFRANKNAQGKAINVLDPPVVAKFARLLPQTAHRWKTLRWGVFGCNESAPTARPYYGWYRTKTTQSTTTTALITTPEPQTSPALDQSPLIGQIFAEEAPQPFFSLDTVHDSGTANGEERCRGAIRLLTEPRGRIMSPNFGPGQNYPPRDSCTWQIFAREDQRIKVVFEILAIEDGYGCQRDYVALYDGPTVGSPPLGKFCGTELPPMLVTSGHQLTIFFNTGDSIEGPGFSLTYYFQQDRSNLNYINTDGEGSTIIMPTLSTTTIDNSLRCDDRIVIVHGLNGKIESPGYGRAQYLSDDMCNWRVVAPERRRVRVVFQDFDLAPGTGPNGRCESEYLSVYDGATDSSRLLGSFCGSKLPPTVMSTGSALFLRFATGAPTGQRAGLRAVFSAVEEPQTEPPPTQPPRTPAPPPTSNNHNNRRPLKLGGEELEIYREEGRCDGQIKIMTQHEGAFWSPRYPSGTYYPNDLCYWLIRAPTGYRIRFFFDSMSLESSPRCGIDNLTLYDGDRDSTPLLGYLCGFETPNESFLTSGQYLLVRFASGSSNSNRRTGFRINYRFINGTLALPLEMPLRLNSFITNELINELSGIHSQNHLNPNIPTLPPGFTTTQVTGGSDPNLGKSPHQQGCHGVKNLLTGDKGVVVSPNFGNGPYWSSDTCFWEVRTVPSKRIRLGFQVFKITWSPECSRDRLIIYDGSSELSRILGTYCGNTLPMPVTSTINVLLLKFVTDARQKTTEDIGFMALYGTFDFVPPTTEPTTEAPTEPPTTTNSLRYIPVSACNGSVAVLTAKTGVITSPDFAENILPSGVMCFWEIRAPPGKRIRLGFETFAMPATEDCIGAHVALFIGSGSARPQIGRFCGDELPPATTSPGDRLFIRFVSGPFSVTGGFAARYSITEPVVEETSTTTSTSTTSTTETTVTTPPSTTEEPVTTTEEVTTSTTDTVTPPKSETPTTTTTSTEPPPALGPSSKCNDGRVVLTDAKGNIKSPNFGIGRLYPRGDSCWWQILLQPGSVIDLKFKAFSLTPSRACTGDRLVIIDGPDARRSPKDAYCGHIPPADFRSSSNIITLHFFSLSDPIPSDFGFELDYAEVVNDNKVETSVEEPERRFEIIRQTASNQNFGTTTPLPLVTSTTTAEVITRPTAENVFSVDGPCSGKVFVLLSDQRSANSPGWKRIASPNFTSRDGSTYSPNDVCFWKIIGPDEFYIIEFRVELIDMTPSGGSCFKSGSAGTTPAPNGDILTIFSGPDEESPLLGSFCGEHRESGANGARLMTAVNQAFVKFTSGPGLAGSSKRPAGFLVAYRAIPKVTDTGIPPFSVPFLPTASLPNTTIKPSSPADITTGPSSFFLKPEGAANIAGKIGEVGTNLAAPQLTRCEGRLQILSQESGIISSPNYGNRNGYAASDSCLWEIIGRGGTKIHLKFKEFDVGIPPYPKVASDKAERCPSDRVVVFDGPGEYYPILTTLCGRLDNGYSLRTMSNAAFVQFVSFPLTDGSAHAGFVLEYSIITTSLFGEEVKFDGKEAPGTEVPRPHQIFAEEAPSYGPAVVPLLSDPVVQPLPPGVIPAGYLGKSGLTGITPPAAPWWWCDDDLVVMLPDQAISASSEQGQYHPKLVRDRRDWTPSPTELPCCWQPNDHDSNPFVQFDFGGPHMIGAARIIDMRPVLSNVTNTPALYLLVSESFETASDSRIPLTASDTKINIKPPIIASKVRVYMVRQRTADNKLVMPQGDHDRPLIRISLFGCAAPSAPAT